MIRKLSGLDAVAVEAVRHVHPEATRFPRFDVVAERHDVSLSLYASQTCVY